MNRDAGMRAALVCCGMLLAGVACAAAAAVTHGDLMMLSRSQGVLDWSRVQFYGPTGKLKATITLEGFTDSWGRAVSQDGRYAAIGYDTEDVGWTVQGLPRVSSKIVFLQLTGASPKVIGIKTLPGANDGRYCYDGSPLALKNNLLPDGAGTVLDVYISLLCLPMKQQDICARFNLWGGNSAIQHWSVTHRNNKGLGPLVTGDRAAFPENVKCDAVALPMIVTANAKVYAAFAFNANAAKAGFVNTIGVYEVRRNPRGGTRLVSTWKFKIGATNNFRPTGPTSGCALINIRNNAREITKIQSLARNRVPYVGGVRGRPEFDAYEDGSYYDDINCRGPVIYAILGRHVNDVFSDVYRVLKISDGLLKKGASGRVIINATRSGSISIIP